MRPLALSLTVVFWAALAYSVAIVWGCAWLVAAARSRPFPVEETMPLLIQTFIAFLPFGLFLLLSKYRRVRPEASRTGIAAVAGLACSFVLWGYYLYEGLTYDGRGGVNIGLGILMFASPLIVYAPMHLLLSRNHVSNGG